jgi:5-methylcytosine-specific restriction endonuclease McrA
MKSILVDIYDDTPETAPKIKSTLPSKKAAIRKARSSSEYQTARDHYRNHAQSQHEQCWLCGEPINYQLKFPHPRSWSLDHLIPITDNPRLILEPNNFRSAHLDCNRHRGSEAPPSELGVPSERW